MRLLQILTYLCLLLCAVISSHSQEIENLHNSLKNAVSAEEKTKILSAIGDYFASKEIYYDSAYFYTEQSLQIAQKEKLPRQEIRAIFNLGFINSEVGKKTKAIKNYEDAIDLLLKMDINTTLGQAYNNLGAVNFEIGAYDKAEVNYRKSLEVANYLKDTVGQAVCYMNIGEVNYIQKELLASKGNFEKSQSMLASANVDFPTIHLFYARTLFELGELEKAKKEAFASLEQAKQSESIKYISEASQLLAQIFEKKNEFQSAFEYQKQYTAYNETLNEAKELNEIEKLKLNFELKEKQEEIALISQRNKYQNIITILAAAGLSLMVVLIFRQRKIVKMTKNIHDIQKRLIEFELNHRETTTIKNATGFEAARMQDLDH